MSIYILFYYLFNEIESNNKIIKIFYNIDDILNYNINEDETENDTENDTEYDDDDDTLILDYNSVYDNSSYGEDVLECYYVLELKINEELNYVLDINFIKKYTKLHSGTFEGLKIKIKKLYNFKENDHKKLN